MSQPAQKQRILRTARDGHPYLGTTGAPSRAAEGSSHRNAALFKRAACLRNVVLHARSGVVPLLKLDRA
jgi:hypothetical protein